MKIDDKLQDHEIQIIKALYEHGKKKTNEVTFQADSYRLSGILNELKMPENIAKSALKNLADFEFVEWEKDNIKLLPSGIKYSMNVFE